MLIRLLARPLLLLLLAGASAALTVAGCSDDDFGQPPPGSDLSVTTVDLATGDLAATVDAGAAGDLAHGG